MERQNRGELLSCLRQACSHAETNLMQLIDSLQEPELDVSVPTVLRSAV